jgi:hypothetical protein
MLYDAKRRAGTTLLVPGRVASLRRWRRRGTGGCGCVSPRSRAGRKPGAWCLRIHAESSLKGARAKAWCLLTHAEASLSLTGGRANAWTSVYSYTRKRLPLSLSIAFTLSHVSRLHCHFTLKKWLRSLLPSSSHIRPTPRLTNRGNVGGSRARRRGHTREASRVRASEA